MNPRPLSGLLACLLLLSASAHAAEPETPVREAGLAVSAPVAHGPTEEELLRRWIAKSAEVESWRTSLGAGRFDVVAAEVLPNPEIEVGGMRLLGGEPPDGKFGLSGTLSVPLPIFGHIGSRREAAKRQLDVTEVAVVEMLWTRAGELAQAMVERAFANARMKMIGESLVELDRIERVVTRRAAAGANSPYDVLRVRMARGIRRAAEDQARIQRDQAEFKIVALLADPSLREAPITRTGLRAFSGPDDEAALIAGALQRRPDLEIARRGAKAAKAVIARERKDAIPIPSISANPYYVGGPYGLQLTLGLSVPLPVFDRNQGSIGRATEEARGNELLVKARTERVRAEVKGAYQARSAAKQALDGYRAETMSAVTELLKRAEVTYEAGAFSIAELFDAYETLWSARDQELDLEQQHAEAEVALEQAAVLLPLSR